MANGCALTGGSHWDHTVRPFVNLPIDEILVRFQVQQTVSGHRGHKPVKEPLSIMAFTSK